MKNTIIVAFLALVLLSSCSKSSSGTYTAVKPRYHHSWYKNSVNKKNWHVGRIKFRFEKQGVKKVKMKG